MYLSNLGKLSPLKVIKIYGFRFSKMSSLVLALLICGEDFVGYAEPVIPPTVIGTPQVTATAASSTPVAIPIASPTTVPKSEFKELVWLDQPVFRLGQKNVVRTLVGPGAPAEALESEKGEQFLLFPNQSAAFYAGGLFYQRRFSSDLRFGIHRLGQDKALSDEVLRSMPQAFGSFVYCSVTQEFVFQAPPMDAAGKFMVDARPSRVYLFSLQTGKVELIWRRPRDRFGTLMPKMSATPDCMHVLVNQALETKGSKVPFGEIVYLKRPNIRDSASVTVAQDWTFSSVQTMPANGVTKRFSEALFLSPRDPKSYQISHLPPKIFSVTEYIDKKNNPSVVNLMLPTSTKKTTVATSVVWERKRKKIPSWATDLANPVLDEAGKTVFALAHDLAKIASKEPKSQIVSFNTSRLEENEKVHFEGEGIFLTSFDLRPAGDGLIFSFQEIYKPEEIEKLSDKKIGGIGAVTWLNSRPQWRQLIKLFPYSGLEDQHHPNPMFSEDGNEVFFVDSIVGEIADPKLFQVESFLNRSKDVQFGAKLKKWYWNDIKL